MMVVAELASAGHVRPKAASPIRVSLVPAFAPCASPNRTHGTPLAVPSCNPPVQASSSLTVGEPTANGATANSVGFVKLKVKLGVPGPPDDSDVLITASGTDVRCRSGVSTCGAANAVDGADYTGQLQGTASIRISDHYNGVATSGSDPGTAVDLPFPVVTGCTATAGDNTIGSTCVANTSANATVPGVVKDGKRSVVEIEQLQVFDGGPDGLASTGPNELFSVQAPSSPTQITELTRESGAGTARSRSLLARTVCPGTYREVSAAARGCRPARCRMCALSERPRCPAPSAAPTDSRRHFRLRHRSAR